MSESSRSYLALAALLAGSMSGAAQQQGAPQVSQPNPVPQAAQPADSSVLHERTGILPRTIHLDVLVTSGPGQPATGLEQKDFTVLDDKTPAEITSFEAVDERKQPVAAILLIDAVNTGYTEISEERIQIDKFLRANGGKLTLPIALAVLGDQGIKMQGGYSRDGNVLADGLAKYTISLREIGRSAGVQGAEERLDDSLKAIRLLASYEAQRPGRKIILWVSPGWPMLSGPRINLSDNERTQIFNEITFLSTTLRESQTSVYAIDPLGVGESVGRAFYYEQFTAGVKKQSDVSIGNLGLQVIANETGGLVRNSTDVSGLLQESVADNVAYYRLSFEPPPTEKRDVYHSLKVMVAKPGLTVATSTGYYAEP
jgi:VWFA-related protein